MKKFFEEYYKIVFLALAFVLLYPTFRSGYIFLIDWRIIPFVSFSDINWLADSITTIISRLLAIIFSFAIFQRLILLLIVLFLGIGGFRLARKNENIFAQYFAGLFLIFNPFIYSRLMEQPGIALGCLFLVWFWIYLWEYLDSPERKKIILASVLAGLAVATFYHAIFFVAISVFVFLLSQAIKKKEWKTSIKTLSVVGGIVILLNINWLIGSFVFKNNIRMEQASQFSQADLEAFKTRSIGGNSIYFTVLSLQGYWGEKQNRFISIQENPLWEVFFWIIFILSAIGFWRLRKDRFRGWPLLIIFLIVFILALGIASSLTKPLSLWLYDHVPFYIGLREPQKWAALMLLGYAIWGSRGVKALTEGELFKSFSREVGILLALLPVFFCFPMIQGMHSHLTPHQFPLEWKEAKEFLQSYSNQQILFFPWHSYMKLDFAGKNIIVPAQEYFGKNIIRAGNTEFGEVYSHSLDSQSLAIEKYVPQDIVKEKVDYANFAKDMKSLGVQKVILAKADDWKDYLWLDTIGLDKVLENNKLIIYDLK